MAPSSRRAIPWKWIATAVVVAALVAMAQMLPIADVALELVEYVRDAGAVGVAIMALAYVAVTVALLPASVMTLAAGFVYGFAGFAVVWPAAVLGALIAFWLARTVLRGWVGARAVSHPKFAAIDDAIGESGLVVVFLLRLSPVVPFGALNYLLGSSKVKTRDYLVATSIGIIPGAFLYVYFGTLITSAAELSGGAPSGGGLRTAFLVGGSIATVLATVWITRVARRKLAAATA